MAQDANKTTPILQCHGDIDHMVPFSWGNLTAQFLKSLNPSHEIKKLSGVMHSSSPEVKLRTHDPQIQVKVVWKIKCGIFSLKSIFWSLHLFYKLKRISVTVMWFMSSGDMEREMKYVPRISRLFAYQLYTAAVSSLPTCIRSVVKVNIVLGSYFQEMEEAKKFLGRVLTQWVDKILFYLPSNTSS